MTPKQAPIILVGGGTGGHIMPLIAVGEELRARKQPFVYVGGKNSREQRIVTEIGWEFVAIDSGKWRRYFSLKGLGENLVDLLRLKLGFWQSIKILHRTKAKVVFSKGGHVALPMVLAAWVMRRKLVIHESDAIMGLTNRISVRFARRVLTAFSPSVYPNYDARYAQVGVPIRMALRTAAKLKAPKKPRPIILVLCGIQGSVAINSLIKESLPDLLDRFDVVHSAGAMNFEAAKKSAEQVSEAARRHYKVFPFIDRELPYYYQTADLIISRASMTVITEASLFAKALYLIPLPNSASDHQNANAKKLAGAKAAIMKEQGQLTTQQFLSDVMEIMGDETKRMSLGQSLKEYFNEAGAINEVIQELSNG